MCTCECIPWVAKAHGKRDCGQLALPGQELRKSRPARQRQQATASDSMRMWKQPQSSFSVEPPLSPGGAGLTVEHCEREHRECRDEGREGLETVPTVLTINPEVETVEKVESAEQRALRGRVSSRHVKCHVAVAVCTSGCARHDRVSINGRAKVSTRRRLTFELCHSEMLCLKSREIPCLSVSPLQIVATFCQGPVARPSAPVEPLCSWNDFDGFSDFSDAVCFEKPKWRSSFLGEFFLGVLTTTSPSNILYII